MFDMFSVDYIFGWFLGLLPTWLPWAIIGFGIVLFLLVQLFGKLVPLLYRCIIMCSCIVLIGLGSWAEGRQNILSEGAKEVEKVVVKEKIITKVVVQKYTEKVKEIEVVHDQIAEQINTKDDHMCDVPESFVWLHDSAAKNTISESSSATDGASSGVALSTVENTIIDNYGLYHKVAEELSALQEWVSKQKELNP
jgi:hypothetical protein